MESRNLLIFKYGRETKVMRQVLNSNLSHPLLVTINRQLDTNHNVSAVVSIRRKLNNEKVFLDFIIFWKARAHI